jgi:tetratricopeptide (TPR) repeat protein
MQASIENQLNTLNGRLSDPVIARMLAAIVLGLAITSSSSAWAQVDRIVPIKGPTVIGKITEIKRDSVTLESSAGKQTFTIDRIGTLVFDGEPPQLTSGRRAAVDGNYEQAAQDLGGIDFSKPMRDFVKADALFYVARTEAALALAGRGDVVEATRKMRGFASANPQSIHFYTAAKTMGDLAVAEGKHEDAVRFYGALANAPIPELKIEAEYLGGVAKLKQGNAAEADASFTKVIGANVQSELGAQLQTLAKTGKAVALAKQNKGSEAVAMVDSLIAELNPDNSAIAAQIYNAQGASLEAIGDNEGAVLAYLHTHLMFSGQSSAHAEALSRLIELWPKVGNPERANEARQELQQRYPGWKK